MRHLFPLTLFSVLAMTGCSSVSLTEPNGKAIEMNEKSLGMIEGRWQAGNSIFDVKHLDGSRFKVTQIKKGSETVMDVSAIAVVTQTDKEHTYVHFENTDSATGKKGYELLRLGIASGKDSEHFDFVFFMANVQAFAKAIEAGDLTGTIKRELDGKPKTVKLTSSSADIEKWLQAQDNEPFVLSQVSVARKVKKTD